MKKTIKNEEPLREKLSQTMFKGNSDNNQPILIKGLGQEFSTNILENIQRTHSFSKPFQQAPKEDSQNQPKTPTKKMDTGMIQSIHIKKPQKAVLKISRFVGDAKWPFFRVKKDETVKQFWNRRTQQDHHRNWNSEGYLFEGIMLRIGRKKKSVKGYYFKLTYSGMLMYFKKESDKEPKGYLQLSMQSRVIISYQKTKKGLNVPVLYIERVEGIGITIFDHQIEQTLKLCEALQEFCLMRGYDSVYTQIDTLGSGSFATVFKVQRKRDEQQFAAKVIYRNMFEENKHKDKFIQMVYNEVIALKTLSHPGIEQIYEVYQEKDKLVLIIEYCQGGTLYQFYKSKGKLSEKQIAQLMKGILDALFEMHSNGFVHRDLKLENIMLESKEHMQIKLVDFGFAEEINEKELISKAGTPGFLAPEIFRGYPYTQKGDVFSAGCVLYILTAGYAPFRGKPSQIQLLNSKGQVNYEKSPWPDVSVELKSLVKKMLEPKSEDRFTTLEALESSFISHYTKITSETNYKSFQMVSGLDFHNKQSVKSNKNSESNGSKQSKEFQLDFSIHTNDIKSLYQKNSIKTLQSQRSGRGTIKQSMILKQSISVPKDAIIEQYQQKRKQSHPDRSSCQDSDNDIDSFGELLKLQSMKFTTFEDFDALNFSQINFLTQTSQVFNKIKRPW
ncbi:unnamed protein product [Paramecium octaurelia]|uniref:Protein kinase domain-containing protein n=1 Tax=Paramecium octaurelia TaxID=43137 RepID=A0A8S1STL0_PAROT|nr:unnamed protein product [Paramecium octaurelia]